MFWEIYTLYYVYFEQIQFKLKFLNSNKEKKSKVLLVLKINKTVKKSDFSVKINVTSNKKKGKTRFLFGIFISWSSVFFWFTWSENRKNQIRKEVKAHHRLVVKLVKLFTLIIVSFFVYGFQENRNIILSYFEIIGYKKVSFWENADIFANYRFHQLINSNIRTMFLSKI